MSLILPDGEIISYSAAAGFLSAIGATQSEPRHSLGAATSPLNAPKASDLCLFTSLGCRALVGLEAREDEPDVADRMESDPADEMALEGRARLRVLPHLAAVGERAQARRNPSLGKG